MPPPVGNWRGPPHRSRARRSASCLFVSGVLLAVLVAVYGVLDSIKVRSGPEASRLRPRAPSTPAAAIELDAAESTQDRWYIFDHLELHKLAQQAVATHGNDTRGIIDEIVGTLRQSHPASALSSREEWVFKCVE